MEPDWFLSKLLDGTGCRSGKQFDQTGVGVSTDIEREQTPQ